MKDESARIYHGSTAPSPIPWQVQMEVNGFFICGGTILDSKTILTAAHCIYNKDPSVLQISAGLTHRTNLTGAQVKHTFYRIPSHLCHHTNVIQIPTFKYLFSFRSDMSIKSSIVEMNFLIMMLLY